MRCGVKGQEQTPSLSLECRDIERYMCFSLDKFFSTSLKEREALSYRETRGFKLLGEARAKGSSFLEKLEQRFKSFKLLGEARAKGSSFLEKLEQRFKRFKLPQEAKTKVQKVQASSRS